MNGQGHFRKRCKCSDKRSCKHPWSYVVDFGEQRCRKCPTCSARSWDLARPPETCAKCGTPLVESLERRQVWKGGFKTKTGAQAAYRKLLHSVDEGTFVEPDRQTVADFLQEWLDAIATRVRESTLSSYRDVVAWYVSPRIGHVRLQELSSAALNVLYAELLASGRKNDGGLSPRTVRYAHTIIRKALSDAVRWNRVPRNVADQADPPRSGRSGEMKTWTAAELRAFLNSVEVNRLYAAWLLMATTGMRRGEVLGLRWSDVNLDQGTASVQQTLSSVGYKLVFSSPKTKSSRRSVPLEPLTIAALRAHRKAQLEERVAWGPAYQPTDLVFAREDGAPVHPDRFSKVFGAHIKAADLSSIRVHDLRHTYATLALGAGVHPKVVSEILGHSSITITLDTYSHVVPSMKEDATARVAGLIFGSGV